MTYPVVLFGIEIKGRKVSDNPPLYEWTWDIGNEEGDVTVIKHSVSCCRCGKADVVKLDRGDDIVYLDDILTNDGWEKDKYGRWFCDECSYKSGDD